MPEFPRALAGRALLVAASLALVAGCTASRPAGDSAGPVGQPSPSESAAGSRSALPGDTSSSTSAPATATPQPAAVASPTSAIACSTPPAVGATIGRISSAYVDVTVMQGSAMPTIPELNVAPRHYGGTALPGCAGNAAVAGHRTSAGGPFRQVNAFHPGDPITVSTAWGTFVYRVSRVFDVAPTAVQVLDPTPQPTLTLTSCDPPGTTLKRIIVTAVLDGPPIAG